MQAPDAPLPPDPTIKVKEFLASRHVSKVGVVDDGFDAPDEQDLQARWKEFVEYANAVPSLTKDLQALELDPDGQEPPEQIADMDRQIREKGGALAQELGRRVKESPDQNLRRAGIKNLTELMEGRLALNLCKLGTDAARRIEELVGTQIVFLDYYLGEDNSRGITAAVSVVKKVCEACAKRKKLAPMFVLFSRSNITASHIKSLRKRAGIPAWQFRFVPKRNLERDPDIVLRLWELAHGMDAVRGVDKYLKGFRESLSVAQSNLTSILDELNLSDIAYLNFMKLSEERASLSSYLTWLFGAYLQNEILRSEKYRRVADGLDKVDLSQLPTRHGEPTTQVLDLYRDVLYEPAHRKLGRDAKGRRSARLQLGEIYVRSRRGGRKDALLVVNNSCDLARPAPEMGVGLLRGEVIERHKATEDLSHKPKRTRSDAFGINGKHYVVDWSLDRCENIEHKVVFSWLKNENYVLSARMRLENALEIKQLHASLRDRIGLPTAPPMLAQLRVIGAFWRDSKGKFRELIGKSNDNNGELFTIDTYTDGGAKEERFFFSSDFLARLTGEIHEKLKAHGDDATLKALEKFSANYGKLTALMYPKRRKELDLFDVRIETVVKSGDAAPPNAKQLTIYGERQS